jgi:hypothetical protein
MPNQLVASAGADEIDAADRMYWRSDEELVPAWEEAQGIQVPSRKSH